jgi:hypothetical protein
VLLKAKFKVDFAVGTEENPSFGGTLRTPEGHTINLMFRDNLWHVPMWRPPIIIKPTTGAPGVLSDVKVGNYYSSLAPNNRDKRAAKIISSIIVALALYEEGQIGPIEQGFIGNRLQGTDVSEFIHARYGSLVKFLQDGTRHDDFVLIVGCKGTCFIDHAPKLVLPKTVRVSPADSMPLDSDSAALMRLSLSRWGFPCPAGDATRPSELPQENQDVLKKLREMKVGAHIDHAHSISIGRLGEKYYLMIVIDGIDFVWPQTCQVRTNPEDLLHEFLTMSRLKISTMRAEGAIRICKEHVQCLLRSANS